MAHPEGFAETPCGDQKSCIKFHSKSFAATVARFLKTSGGNGYNDFSEHCNNIFFLKCLMSFKLVVAMPSGVAKCPERGSGTTKICATPQAAASQRSAKTIPTAVTAVT